MAIWNSNAEEVIKERSHIELQKFLELNQLEFLELNRLDSRSMLGRHTSVLSIFLSGYLLMAAAGCRL